MRAYHRVDPLMDERKSHYSPAQLGAFLKVQLLAGRQARRGRFRSMKALMGALPAPYARLVGFLIEQGDLIVAEDGLVYVDGWDEWQEGDLTVKDRMAALRNRRRNSTVTGTVTNTVTEPSPTAIRSSVGSSVGVDALSGATVRAPEVLTFPVKGMDGTVTEVNPVADLPADATKLQKLAEELTGRPYVMANLYGGLGQKAIEEQLRPHRWHRVEQAWRQVDARIRASQDGPPTLRQLILAADDLLNPIPSGLPQEAAAAEEQRRYDRRVENTQRRIAEMRGEPA